MQIKIGRKVYNTEKSKEVTRKLVSYFGDSHGYEEVLYHKKDNDFFIYGQGGENSEYPEPRIIAIGLEEALSWLSSILGEEEADIVIRKITEKKLNPRSNSKKGSKA
ncbi:MAG: hypothetical protein GX028_06255 [Clostridiaceae bacterium]|nr:hypothetical protein [Clostridiaceae bacterium]